MVIAYRVLSATVAITLVALALASRPLPALATELPELRVLLIGSSQVRGVKGSLKKLYKSAGIKAKIKGHGPARADLDEHATSPRTAKIISRKPWDYVLIAQNSVGVVVSRDVEHAITLRDRAIAAGAQPLLLMTWLDVGAPLEDYELDLKGTPDGNYGYVPLGIGADLTIAPAGWGIYEALLDVATTGENGTTGQVVPLFRKQAHLSRDGKYLAGLIVYATLSQQSPVGLWAPGRLTTPVATYFQQLAHDVMWTPTGESRF
jgi:hypothetical protein